MTEQSMVEKVARALCCEFDFDQRDADEARETGGENEHWHRNLWFEKARRAIEAMREPTQAMVHIGNERCDFFKHAHDTWTHMIDAALNEKQT